MEMMELAETLTPFQKLARVLNGRIAQTTSGCIEWQGYTNEKGYGQIWRRPRLRLVHRVAYEFVKGPIPPGLQIDHLCRNPRCCNPDHLEAVTPSENTRRGIGPTLAKERAQLLTHCRNGHEINDANTYTRKDGRRQCRACALERQARRRAKRLEAGLTQLGRDRRRARSDRALTTAQLREFQYGR